jgi:RimJ/RimL family protein N-acetyltransferase
MRLRPEDAEKPDSSLIIKELKLSDIDRMLDVMYLTKADIYNRFNRGERCFAILDGEDITTYFWAQFGPKQLDKLSMTFNLRPNQTWFYNAITVKKARGRGYYPNIIRYMVKALKTEDFNEFFIDVEETNRASIRGMEKAGFKRVVKVQMRKILSNIRYKITIFDKDAWQGLTEIITNLPKSAYFTQKATNGN